MRNRGLNHTTFGCKGEIGYIPVDNKALIQLHMFMYSYNVVLP
jgi:hypothetical protein